MVGSAMAREAPPGECRKGWKKEDQLGGYFSRSKREVMVAWMKVIGEEMVKGGRISTPIRWSRALFSHMSCFPLLQVLFLRPPLFIQSLWLLFSPL